MAHDPKTLSWELKYLKKGFALTGLTPDTGRHLYTPFTNVGDFTTNSFGTEGTAAISATLGGGIYVLTSPSTTAHSCSRYATTWLVPSSIQTIPFYTATRFAIGAAESGTSGYLRMANTATYAQEAIVGFIGDVNSTNFMFYQSYTGGTKQIILPPVDTAWHNYEMYGLGDGNLHIIFDGVTYNVTGLSWTSWASSKMLFVTVTGGSFTRALFIDDALLLVPKSP